MKKVLFISSLIIVLGSALTYFVLKENQQLSSNMKNPEFFCGTEDSFPKELSEGKNLFNINCAACHKLNKISDPPILENNIKNYSLESFQKFVHNEERNRENIFEPTECMPFPNLKQEELVNIYNYIIYSVN